MEQQRARRKAKETLDAINLLYFYLLPASAAAASYHYLSHARRNSGDASLGR